MNEPGDILADATLNKSDDLLGAQALNKSDDLLGVQSLNKSGGSIGSEAHVHNQSNIGGQITKILQKTSLMKTRQLSYDPWSVEITTDGTICIFEFN